MWFDLAERAVKALERIAEQFGLLVRLYELHNQKPKLRDRAPWGERP